MDNLRSVIKILFRYTSAVEVLQKNTRYDDIKENSFVTLANGYMANYSNNEIKNMLQYLSNEFQWHNNKMRGQEKNEDERKVNVFDAVLLFADTVLVEENGVPLCRYEHLLRWRDMSVALDEDLFVTAFLAQKDLLSVYNRNLFFWPPVIGHNNKELNNLMKQGVAENHFHLKGSSPTFHLSWLSMMNDVLNPSFKKCFDKYDENRLSTKVSYRVDYAEESLYISYIKAALIRLYLFACLKDDFFTLLSSQVEFESIKDHLKWDKMFDSEKKKYEALKQGENQYVDLDALVLLLPADVYKYYKQALMRIDVEHLLQNTDELLFWLSRIDTCIQNMREHYAPKQLDYMIWSKALACNPNNHLNEVISGERWFLYEMFKIIFQKDTSFKGDLNLFYAYLLIKENIRAELIQVNGNVGFNNFLVYQNRKEHFIDGTDFEEVYLKMAVRDTILNQNIKKLEARITPKITAYELKKAIQKNDDYIINASSEDLKDRFFYVCHFIKEEDAELKEKDRAKYSLECRHYLKRKEVKTQAHAIHKCRREYVDEARRIRGVDAASEEIVCRPEVFAQAFRFLKNDYVSYKNYKTGEETALPDLSVTYHVGEDFLDVIDGLRAIDEAVCFLNLRCGDRLGHALALGVDVDNWYESKSNRILISQMDYLDNLVWLYAKIRKYRIEGCEDVIRYIEKRYNEYFRVVYLNNMSQNYLDAVVDEAIKYYDRKNIQHNYENPQYYFSINTYYDAWKLRGDNPEFFKRGFFQLDTLETDEWSKHGINKVFPENYRIRYNPEAAYLYHTYHYNHKVKLEGDKKKEIRVNVSIIKAVKKVQKRMQYEIAKRGICIETNPSSNALIGTFKRYDKHPILNWYNNGLASSSEELQSVPQIQVSINTDDQGVFATYIENEYAYLALALEKLKDENGNQKYSRTLIYQWLDNIRKMGLSQSFESVME